jgi:hypothetical protein
MVHLEFEFGPAVSYVMLLDQPPPIKLPVTGDARAAAVRLGRCPKIQFDEPGDVRVPGSILPEGITIALPLRGSTTVTKHESLVGLIDIDHHVEVYAPRQNR